MKDDETKLPMKTFALLAIVVVVVQTGVGTAIYFRFGGWTERGQFGDMFGAINALFSGLALAGVVFAILLQREELRLQRQELKWTREELARAAKAQEMAAREAELSRLLRRPILELKTTNSDSSTWRLALTNLGESVVDVSIVGAPGTVRTIQPQSNTWAHGAERTLLLTKPETRRGQEQELQPIELRFRYTALWGERFEIPFRFDPRSASNFREAGAPQRLHELHEVKEISS